MKEGIFVLCERSNEIRYVTRLTGKTTFEDDGLVSKQKPSPYCHFEYYTPLSIQEYGEFIYGKN